MTGDLWSVISSLLDEWQLLVSFLWWTGEWNLWFLDRLSVWLWWWGAPRWWGGGTWTWRRDGNPLGTGEDCWLLERGGVEDRGLLRRRGKVADRGVHWEADQCHDLTSLCWWITKFSVWQSKLLDFTKIFISVSPDSNNSNERINYSMCDYPFWEHYIWSWQLKRCRIL